MLYKIWNYIRGYVIINVEGYFLEKFINICLHRHITMWNVEKISNRQMLLFIYVSDFFKLRPVVKKSKCRVMILKRCGLPFLIRRYRARKAFALGAGVFVLLLFLMTSFIWKVEITGNSTVDSNVIAQKLINLGAKPGVLKSSVDVKKIADEMILGIKELAWVSVDVRGTKIKVQVAERQIPPAVVKKNEPCDIYAARDGIIKSMVVKEGMKMVTEGTTVTRGQLLVAGTVPNKNEKEPSRQVHAIAEVKARTWYEKQEEVITKTTERVYGENSKNIFYLAFLDKKIRLIPGKVRYADFEKTVDVKNLRLGRDFELPFSFITEKYTEVKTLEKEFTAEEATQTALDRVSREIVDIIPPAAEIIKTDKRLLEAPDGKTYAVITVECLEDIGEEKQIGGN